MLFGLTPSASTSDFAPSGFRRERIVRERPSLVDAKGRAFGLRD
jgi:hypothetical protein